MRQDLFLIGLLMSAAAEAPFSVYARIWNHDLDDQWQLAARENGWCSGLAQAFHWGDPNSDGED